MAREVQSSQLRVFLSQWLQQQVIKSKLFIMEEKSKQIQQIHVCDAVVPYLTVFGIIVV